MQNLLKYYRVSSSSDLSRGFVRYNLSGHDTLFQWSSCLRGTYEFVPDCPPFADDLLLWLDSTGISYVHELPARAPYIKKLLALLFIFSPVARLFSCQGQYIWFSWHYWNLILRRFLLTASNALVMQPLRP